METLIEHKLPELQEIFPGMPLRGGVEWSEVSTLGIGSQIAIIAEPTDDLQLLSLLKYCAREDIAVRTIGAGSNIVGCDKPFKGVIIRLLHNCFSKIVYGRHQHITVGAGIKLADLLRELAAKGFGGAAPLAPVPGTLGGAIRMNAGAHGVEIKDFITEICGLTDKGEPWTAAVEDLEWVYRGVNIPRNIIITGAICQFSKVDPESEFKLINDEFNWRNKHFPPGRSTGCVFRNPSSAVSAGKLIDDAGCKGLTCGGAVVSDKHANYLLNAQKATESDYIQLITKVKSAVLSKFSINLLPELHFVDEESDKKIRETPRTPEVIVMKGGDSNEREISIQSGDAVETALKAAGYRVKGVTVDGIETVAALISSPGFDKHNSVIFPVLHGGYGEDGTLQKLLEENEIAFAGCGSESCRLAMNKPASKKIMVEKDFPTPNYTIVSKESCSFPAALSLPFVVKPPEEGSTVGITLVSSEIEWESALEKGFSYADELLVEEYIKGDEITVGILCGQVLPVVEIEFPGAIFDYDAKYEHRRGETLYLCPPMKVSGEAQRNAQKVALDFAEAIGYRDITRIDFIVDAEDRIYILEANNIPGFTSSSLLPKAAWNAGISFEQLCGTLVQAAARRIKA